MSTRVKRRMRFLCSGASSLDRAFDELVPADLRHLSRVHWTPVDIAVRAVALLCPHRDTRVLDVGSGVGKLCTVGALSEMGTWCGIEQHEALVRVAARIARRLGAGERTLFVHGDVFAVEWRDFDALYLYNPFEHRLASADLIDIDADADARVQAARVRERLATLRPGTRVVTLHGFGGVMPASYTLVYHEQHPIYGLDLVLWVQGPSSRTAWRLS